MQRAFRRFLTTTSTVTHTQNRLYLAVIATTGAVATAYSNASNFPLVHQPAEAAFKDKNLEAVIEKINDGLDVLYEKYPNIQRVRVSSGMRGIRYFLEFPIKARHVDAYSLLTATNKKLETAKKNPTYNVRVTGNDSYLTDDSTAYTIDYKVNSTSVEGSTSNGTVYIRGAKGYEGYDSFKFELQKANDFSDFDVELVLNAYEHAFLNLNPEQKLSTEADDSSLNPAQKRFRKKMASK